MGFLEELKAQKGLGKKPPPKIVKEPEVPVVKRPPIDPPVPRKTEVAPMKAENKTREQWLEAAYVELNKKVFKPSGFEAPKCRISVGFPAGSRPKTVQKTLGQYWPPGATSDGVPQIFISPSKYASGDPVEMLGVLVHEMCHAVTPGGGHGKEFRKVATAIGLKGPMRTTAVSRDLRETLKDLVDGMGGFPHGTIDPSTKKGQKGKLRGYECMVCGFKLYTTQKWVHISGGSLMCPSKNCEAGSSEVMEYVPPKS